MKKATHHCVTARGSRYDVWIDYLGPDGARVVITKAYQDWANQPGASIGVDLSDLTPL